MCACAVVGLAVGAGAQPDINELAARATALVSNDRLRETHIALASEVHVAGTPGDQRTVERIEVMFAAAGLTVERHPFEPLLSVPQNASLTITAPETLSLQIRETPFVQQDPAAASNDSFGWNAYSGSGDVTARVVYVNYGTDEDFKQLAEMGVDARGAIALVRYGRNYRGYKVTYAQRAGCAGVIMFTDPGDSGFSVGPVYPLGGYASDCCIQRGSVMTAPFSGDVLTPGVEATVGMESPAQEYLDSHPLLPNIPVQPIGYAAAKEILLRMKGVDAPAGWQGGFHPRVLTYKLTSDGGKGDSGVRVRMVVEQERKKIVTANVLGRLEGSKYPEQVVVVGAHHDAWNHGAADPLCGTITVIEAARVLGELAAKGVRPVRTVIFAAWGAEEFGIIGSNEWVERNITSLSRNGVMYINLDMASMGPNLGISASPSLRGIALWAAGRVRQAGNPAQSALDNWASVPKAIGDVLRPRMPSIGALGGGSDHVGFLCHAGVASMAIGAGGSKGTSYHSAFDTLPWYWKVVGSDYESARMVASVTLASVIASAYVEAPGFTPAEYAYVAAESLRDAQRRAREAGFTEVTFGPALAAAAGAALAWERTDQRNSTMETLVAADRVFTDPPPAPGALLTFHDLPGRTASAASSAVPAVPAALAGERSSMSIAQGGGGGVPEGGVPVTNGGLGGLPGRPWFRNNFASTDETSGYAAWILPRVQHALLMRDEDLLTHALQDLTVRLENLSELAPE